MKTIEQKFQEWHSDMPCENYYPYMFIFEAGYNLAKKELEEQLKELLYYKEMWQSIAGKANLENLVKAAEEAREVIEFAASNESMYQLYPTAIKKMRAYLEKWK